VWERGRVETANRRALAAAVELVESVQRVAVLTGAGISTDSGIPDFRGPGGLWERDPEAEKYSTIGHYLSDPEIRSHVWRARLDSPVFSAEPNAGHRALVGLEQQGRLELLVTQNVDGLHLRAGNSPERVVEVHGSVRNAMCVRCDWRGPLAPVLDRVRAGEADPSCEACAGILKSTTVLFGERLAEDDIERAMRAAEESELLLCVGTTLAVHPAATMVPRALGSGRPVVILNGAATEMDGKATVVVQGSISELLPKILGMGGSPE
jgi:NAD-dependent deacetylase